MRQIIETGIGLSENDLHQENWDATSIVKTSPDDFNSSSISAMRGVPWQASVCEHTSKLIFFLTFWLCSLPKITPEKEQFGSLVNSKLSQKKWQAMEHFGFMIVPGAITPSYQIFEKYR